MDARTALLLRQLDRAFDGRGWHGPTLMGALRGLDEAAASWRPAPEAHSRGPAPVNAWEYAVHAAYWTYRVLRHVAAEPPARFDEPGSNFFARPADGRTLAGDVARLRDWHQRLVAAVEAFDPERLGETAYDGYSFEDVIGGVAAHDAYHAGQIRLLRRLQGDA